MAVLSRIAALGDEQENCDPERKHVEDAGNVKEPESTVDDASTLVEARSLGPNDVATLDFIFGCMMHDWLELVVELRLEVELTELHDHLERNEVDDAVLDGVLEGQ